MDAEKARTGIEEALACGDCHAAYGLATEILEKHPKNAELHYLAGQAAQRFDVAAALRHLRQANMLEPRHLAIGRSLANLLMETGHRDEAVRIVNGYLPEDLEDFRPDRTEVLLFPGRWTRDHIAADDGIGPQNASRWALTRCLHITEIDDALAALDRCGEATLTGENRDFLDVLRGVMGATRTLRLSCPEPVRQNIEWEIERQILGFSGGHLAFPADSDVTVVFFSGFAGHMNILPLDKFHWHARTLPANIVYVRDTMKCLHLSGIQGIDGRLDGAVDYLGELLAAMGTRKLVSVGFSSGSFAALAYGMRLGARRCLAFSPVSRLDDGILDDDPRGSANPQARRVFQRLARDLDLRKLIRSHPDSRVDLYYGDGCGEDKIHVDYLRDLRNVRHHPVPSASEHGIAMRMIARGSFRTALAAVIGPAGDRPMPPVSQSIS